MKKIVLSLSLTLALVFASCSTDETPVAPVAEQAIEKTDVPVVLTQPSSSNTDKSIKRNDIPASVAVVKLKAVFNPFPSYFVQDQWNVVADNASGTEENIILKDIAVGSNTFTLTTETTATKKFELVTASGDADARITLLKKNVPYALYDGTLVKNIVKTGNIVTITATTPHGRLLTVFQLENNGVYKNVITNQNEKFAAQITAKIVNASGTVLATNNGPKIDNNGLASFEWSNELSVAGNKVVYTVDVTPYPNNNDNQHTIYTVEQAIKASTSISCIYTVGKDKVPSPVADESKIVFAFQKWIEENCPDYPNCK